MPSTPSPQPPSGGPDAGTGAAVAAPSKANAGDPLFQRPEPETPGGKRSLLLWQYFFFPVLIVVSALGLFLLFGLLGKEETTPEGMLTVLLDGGENRQQQASQQLAIAIAEERNRVDEQRRAGKAIEPAPFYAEAGFQERLLRAFRLARDEESDERQQGIARALGRAEVPAAIPVLLDVLYPAAGGKAASSDVRRAAAAGLLHFEPRLAEAAYVKMAGPDEKDVEVRTMGMSGLALLGLPRHGSADADSPAVAPLLTAGLEAPSAGIRLNAAYGLARRGDASGKHLLEQSLSRDGLKELGVDPAFQSAALGNAIGSALALRDSDLKPLVERLTDTAHEGDDVVRAAARQALARWDQVPDAATSGGQR